MSHKYDQNCIDLICFHDTSTSKANEQTKSWQLTTVVSPLPQVLSQKATFFSPRSAAMWRASTRIPPGQGQILSQNVINCWDPQELNAKKPEMIPIAYLHVTCNYCIWYIINLSCNQVAQQTWWYTAYLCVLHFLDDQKIHLWPPLCWNPTECGGRLPIEAVHCSQEQNGSIRQLIGRPWWQLATTKNSGKC